MASNSTYQEVAASEMSEQELNREIDQLLDQEDQQVPQYENQAGPETTEMEVRESEQIDIMEIVPQPQTSIQIDSIEGVFSNMAVKPNQGKVFEEIEPPSYHDTIVDPSPSYDVTCVDDQTGEILIEGKPEIHAQN